MLILENWINEKGGALLRTEDGIRIFRTLTELEEDYFSFSHTSTEGVLSDKHIFVHKQKFLARLQLSVG